MLLDRSLDSLKREYLQYCAIVLIAEEESPSFDFPGTRSRPDGPYRLLVDVDVRTTFFDQVVAAALRRLKIRDLVIENPPLEEIVKAIYRKTAIHGVAHVGT